MTSQLPTRPPIPSTLEEIAMSANFFHNEAQAGPKVPLSSQAAQEDHGHGPEEGVAGADQMKTRMEELARAAKRQEAQRRAEEDWQARDNLDWVIAAEREELLDSE
jgi:hypothetical protein